MYLFLGRVWFFQFLLVVYLLIVADNISTSFHWCTNFPLLFVVGFALFLQISLYGLSTHCFLLVDYSLAHQGPVLPVRGTLHGLF